MVGQKNYPEPQNGVLNEPKGGTGGGGFAFGRTSKTSSDFLKS